MKNLLLLLFFISPQVFSQACGPAPMPNPPICLGATPVRIGLTEEGGYVRWDYVTSDKLGVIQSYIYVGTWPEIAKVSSRVNTIRFAANPLLSLQTLPRRITVLPATDPLFQNIYAKALADK